MLTIEKAKTFCKQNGIKGLDIRGSNSIRIVIKKNNQRFNFSLDNASLTTEGLLLAAAKVIELKKLAKYSYLEFIKAHQQQDLPPLALAPLTKPIEPPKKVHKPLQQFIDCFYLSKENTLAPSSISNYRKKIDRYIVPKFGLVPVEEIKPMQIQSWVLKDLSHLSNKTIKDLVCFLNQIFTQAIVDEAISINPLDKLKASKVLKLKATPPEREPFSHDEIHQIITSPTPRQSEINMFHFNCFTGLRIGELMALSWSDIDLNKGTISVTRAVVDRVYKSPKNLSSKRTISLMPQAISVLLKQQKLPMITPCELKVLNADNKSFRKEQVSFVFYNSQTLLPFIYDGEYRLGFFRPHLKRAGVKYRGANQTRHTYASHLVSAGLPLTWIAKQMGHTGIKMIEKHYAKWMPTHEDKYTDLASKAF
ncbi:MAG: site-specific integrase [Colwellia sp.]|nr:site-specific integrase [Colwellia sp.]